MNLVKLSASYIFRRPLGSLLNFLLLSFGIGLAVLLVLFSGQVEQRFTRDLAGIDLVVGAKGSPLQLVLSSLLHIDVPTGNIPLSEAKEIASSKLVYRAYPISLGDSYHGFPIMGTDLTYMTAFSNLDLESGYWPQQILEALVGWDVAQKTGLKKGDHFVGSHGLTEGGEEHTEFPYLVTGVLEKTGSVTDRLILTKTGTVDYIHAHHDEDEEGGNKSEKKEPQITALLITYATPAAGNILPQIINRHADLVAASPALEVAKLLKFLGVGIDTIAVLSYALIAMAGVSIFITLLKSLRERSYDIAIMRTLGASRAKIFSLMILEGLIYSVLGTVAGFITGHVAAEILGMFTENSQHINITGLVFFREEIYIAAGAVVIGIIAALLPAALAYRADIAKILNRQ